MSDAERATAAAQSLISLIGLPPTHHSVYIRTETDETGEFKRSLNVHFHPQLKKKPQLPTNHMGFDVIEQPWPKDLR